MRTFLTIITTLTLTTLFGQTDHVDKGQKDLWLTAKLYPSISDNANWYGFNEFYTSFQKRPVLFGGLELTKELNDKWYIETGLLLCDWGFKERGETDGDPKIHSYKEQYLYLTLPVTAIYRHKQFYFGLGLNASYFLKHNHTRDGKLTVYNQPDKGRPVQPIDYWLFGYNAKAGLNMPLTDRLTFRPEMYWMLGQNRHGFPRVWYPYGLYSFGLGLGLDYKIKMKKTAGNKG